MGRFRKKFCLSVSVYLFVPEKKAGGWGNVFVNTPLKFIGLFWKFWKNQSSLKGQFHKSVKHSLKIPRPKNGTLKLCGFFVDYPCKFNALSNSIQEFPHPITSNRSHFHVFKPIVWVSYWNYLIQKGVWAMTSSEWELHVAGTFLTTFKHLKGVSTFLLILDKKQLTYKVSKGRRIAKAGVVGLDNLSSNLRIIILCLIT